jgi:hypothetical protein
MSWITFDIETEPMDEQQLRAILPPFDESQVKYGNTKDEAKRAAKLEECKAKYETDFFSKAALNPTTGRVLVIGFYSVELRNFVVHEGDEREILTSFWRDFSSARVGRCRMVGVNCYGFDLPFLIRRSWILGVTVPPGVVQFDGEWVRWSHVFLDLRRVWQLGDRQAESSFDLIGKALGTGGKREGESGADFYKLWREDRDRAIEYLKNDCVQPAEWLERIGFIKDWL